jgi:hypothetical protein
MFARRASGRIGGISKGHRMVGKFLIALAIVMLWTAQASLQAPRVVLLSDDYVGSVSITLEIIDPDRWEKLGRTERPDPEFYEGYGITFAPDARDDGPICVDRTPSGVTSSTFPDVQVNVSRRCITLETLRSLIWGKQ